MGLLSLVFTTVSLAVVAPSTFVSDRQRDRHRSRSNRLRKLRLRKKVTNDVLKAKARVTISSCVAQKSKRLSSVGYLQGRCSCAKEPEEDRLHLAHSS